MQRPWLGMEPELGAEPYVPVLLAGVQLLESWVLSLDLLVGRCNQGLEPGFW